jgi:hypothetical protein
MINTLLIKPTFKGVQYAEESINLAAWEAAKDFQNVCQSIQVRSLVPVK